MCTGFLNDLVYCSWGIEKQISQTTLICPNCKSKRFKRHDIINKIYTKNSPLIFVSQVSLSISETPNALKGYIRVLVIT